ncbi:Nicotinamide riboside transporter PnuC [Botrimarina mediterranea]|uniref:Nicotinamide riboside transporter PnuC n=1 Tax=Botrimarina mediterranea TaxID=2528022 RepID=A0A518KB20_9BACT|nr:Nicotinamide riboside transporter PnuC [Botrimarina mediterranea]
MLAHRSPALQSENLLTGILTLMVCVLALFGGASGAASWLEATSFVTGAACVWLTVKENVWNFPIGLVNVTTFSVVFFQARLYADAGLQIVYFALGVAGWMMWLHGGANRSPLKVTRAPLVECVLSAVFVSLGTIALWSLLTNVGGSASFWDALTTSLSLASQWLLNRKRVESWLGWILVDVIYVPLYLCKELYLTALLYAVFLAMAVVGLKAWTNSWRLQVNAQEDSGAYQAILT